MKRTAVLTSGGDSPGMNAAIRAVVRCGCANGWEVWGIRDGFAGLLRGDFRTLGPRDVSGIIQLGGTMLASSRCREFHHPAAQQKAAAVLRENGVSSLIVIGGNGSQAGAEALSRGGFPVVGIASTIDNDLCGSEPSVGADTALNIALEAIDRLKATAASHHRAFIVEVMGRDCGYLALMAGIAGGAEAVIIPEVDTDPEAIAAVLAAAYAEGKPHGIIVAAEGARYNARGLARYFEEHRRRLGFELRETILGHVQRGGMPSAFDRLTATRLGAAAIDCVERGEHGVMLGWLKGEIAKTALSDVVARKKTLDAGLLPLAELLAR
ncbi:MAG: ATP-dependent 6-phosphofructokinase [Elusimicrobiota bacterium]